MFGRKAPAALDHEYIKAAQDRAARNGPVYPPLTAEQLRAIADGLPRSRGRETGRLATS